MDRKLIQIYALCGLLAGFAGQISLAQYGTTTIAGQSLTNLNVIAAVVIGGTSIFGGQGSMLGSMVGLFIPAVLLSGFIITGVSPFWQTVAVGAILIAAVFVDQQRRAAAARGGRSTKRARRGTAPAYPGRWVSATDACHSHNQSTPLNNTDGKLAKETTMSVRTYALLTTAAASPWPGAAAASSGGSSGGSAAREQDDRVHPGRPG